MRRRPTAPTRALLVAAASLAAIAFATGGIGLVFAGSPARLAEGTRIAGVDVGGLSPRDAVARLEERSDALRRVAVSFVAGGREWRMTPKALGVDVDWRAAVESARRSGDGVAPVRGLRRLKTRLFGADVTPPVDVFEPALRYQLARLARALDRPPRQASLVLRGLRPEIVPAQSGRVLDRAAAEATVMEALAGFSRRAVPVPVRVAAPTVVARDLMPALRRTRVAVSAPVRLVHGKTRWRLPRSRVASLLRLPRNGVTRLAVGGPGAAGYFERLERRVGKRPADADFAVSGEHVRVRPARPGVAVDVEATSAALLAAALDRRGRVARLTLAHVEPQRTTAEARAMGITRLVGGYTTLYGGEPNRLHNVRLVSRLIDGALIAPGATFSFNATTGERTADKGFREAPVIINGELQTGLGGGVCQVSTTVFNAAYESGLPIMERTNHALYIDHYPLGRDATVNYPDLDLRFRNDTSKWLLLRTFVGESALTVNLYGAPLSRRVETQASPLVELAAPPVRHVRDPSRYVGERVVVDGGEPSRSTEVRRTVYDANGRLLYDTTWRSYYRAEPAIVHVGTKPRPKPEPKARPSDAPAEPKKQKPKPAVPAEDPGAVTLQP